MNQCICSAGENNFTVGVVLPGLQMESLLSSQGAGSMLDCCLASVELRAAGTIVCPAPLFP